MQNQVTHSPCIAQRACPSLLEATHSFSKCVFNGCYITIKQNHISKNIYIYINTQTVKMHFQVFFENENPESLIHVGYLSGTSLTLCQNAHILSTF